MRPDVFTLPATLATVDVPRLLSPSALGASGGCVLRLIVSSPAVHVARLPSGPEASIGTLFHRVLERWARAEGADDPLELFDAEYARLRDELVQDPNRRHFAELASAKGRHAWTCLRARAAERCESVQRSPPQETTCGMHAAVAEGVPLGSERSLASDLLRLGGQADRIRQIGAHAYEVRDFKTGNVLGDDGELKPPIRLQLCAYGLMILELDPDASVRLVVDDGDEHVIPFDAPAQLQAREDISTIVSGVPPPGAARAPGLATPGPGCHGCSIRHVCGAYREAAPAWWRSFPEDLLRAPDDVWGTLTQVVPNPVAGVDLVLTDAAGRRVRIDALDARHCVDTLPGGSRVWLFGLQATGRSRGYNGKRFHPRVFHELPRDAYERRAWSALVFLEA